jgi:hypothetical protein
MPSAAQICKPPGARRKTRNHRRRSRALGHARFSSDPRRRRPRDLLRGALRMADLDGIDARCGLEARSRRLPPPQGFTNFSMN